MAQRICRMVAQAPVKKEKEEIIPLTISLGVASLGDLDAAIGQLLRKADQALHQAKSRGRNQACCFATFRINQIERVEGMIPG